MRPACGKEVPLASRLRAGGPACVPPAGRRSRVRPACGQEVPRASRLRAGDPIGVPPLDNILPNIIHFHDFTQPPLFIPQIFSDGPSVNARRFRRFRQIAALPFENDAHVFLHERIRRQAALA